jgi:hypothetical protein
VQIKAREYSTVLHPKARVSKVTGQWVKGGGKREKVESRERERERERIAKGSRQQKRWLVIISI